MKHFDEVGTRLRFLHEYAKLKKKYLFKDIAFGLGIGLENSAAKQLISLLKKGKVKISLEIIQNTYYLYSEFDRNYVLDSEEVPEVEIISLRGADLEHKAGKKKDESIQRKRYNYHERKFKKQEDGLDQNNAG